MYNRLITALAALILLFSTPIILYAQSMQVIGGEQSAANCYMAATIASQTHIASRDNIEECTFALDHTSIRYRDRIATYINRGIIHVAMENYDQAVKDYDRAYRLDPDIAELHVNRGNLYFMGQVYDQAVAEYSRAIELDLSKVYVALYNRGLAYEKMGELDKAEADYRRALEIFPQWSHAQNKLDRILTRIRQVEDT